MATNDVILDEYRIDGQWLEDEAWYLWGSFEEEYTEEEMGAMVEKLMTEAMAPCPDYSNEITNFAAWVCNSRYADEILDAMSCAVGEYARQHIKEHLPKKEYKED